MSVAPAAAHAVAVLPALSLTAAVHLVVIVIIYVSIWV
jgi:hypothetical protein